MAIAPAERDSEVVDVQTVKTHIFNQSSIGRIFPSWKLLFRKEFNEVIIVSLGEGILPNKTQFYFLTPTRATDILLAHSTRLRFTSSAEISITEDTSMELYNVAKAKGKTHAVGIGVLRCGDYTATAQAASPPKS